MSKHNFVSEPSIVDKLNDLVGFRKKPLQDNSAIKDWDLHTQLSYMPSKRFYGYDLPFRSLVFLGWDENNEPSLCIFYGQHEGNRNDIESEEDNGRDCKYVLNDDVEYECYFIVKGSGKRIPKFPYLYPTNYRTWSDGELIKSIELLSSSTRDNPYSYKPHEGLVQLDKKIKLPFFQQKTYNELLNIMMSQLDKPIPFRFAKTPNETFNLTVDEKSIYSLLTGMFMNKNIYLIHKNMDALLEKSIDSSTWDKIISFSNEAMLSGLFLKASKKKDDRFIDYAKQVLDDQMSFGSIDEKYLNGLYRCASLYLRTFDSNEKALRIEEMQSKVDELQLHISELSGIKYDKNHVFSGDLLYKASRKNFLDMRKNDYYYYYDSIYKDTKLYSNHFFNGEEFDEPKLKHMIQESYAYGEEVTLAKIAYYLDSPMLRYYFSNNNRWKALNYYRRYIRRAMDEYAKTDTEKYASMMITLFSMYKSEDYLTMHTGNFQFNYYIKEILFNKFDWNPPTDYWEWQARVEYLKNDQFLKEEKPMMKHLTVWKEHPYIALEILIKSDIPTIKKACSNLIMTVKNYNMIFEKYSIIELLIMKNRVGEEVTSLIDKVLRERLANQDDHINVLLDLLITNQHDHAIKGHEETVKIFCDVLLSSINYEDTSFERIMDALLMCIYSPYYKQLMPWKKEIIESIIFNISTIRIKEKLDHLELSEDQMVQEDDLQVYLYCINYDVMPSISLIKSLYLSESPLKIKSFAKLIDRYKISVMHDNELLLSLYESQLISLQKIACECFDGLSRERKNEFFEILLTSDYDYPKKACLGLLKNKVIKIKSDWLIHLIEHPDCQIQLLAVDYLKSSKDSIFNDMEMENAFIYLARSIMLVPNKFSKAKDDIIDLLPMFIKKYPECMTEVESLLLDMGHSNCISDSERALMTLVKIKEI